MKVIQGVKKKSNWS